MTRLKKLFSDIEAVPLILQNSYYPSLDGLRGIAIIMVVFSHLFDTNNLFFTTVFNGHLGVIIFFVLSGFLITTLCMKEKVVTGDISLKNFYVRRILRIFPVAYLYILVVVLLNLVFKLHISFLNILGTALYLMNFSSYFRKYDTSWFTAHFWSLSVEEQFYLFIPFILKKKFKVYLSLILLIVFVIPVIICLQYLIPWLNSGPLYAFSHYLIKFNAIAIGCLFSVLTFKYSVSSSILLKNKVLLNVTTIFLIVYIQYNDYFNLQDVLKGVACSFLTGYIIISNITPSKDWIFRFLNTKFLKITGTLSYSIYIWQAIFTSNDKSLPAFMVVRPYRPYNIICIIVVSCLSYYLYERFFLRLKSKFSETKKAKPAIAL